MISYSLNSKVRVCLKNKKKNNVFFYLPCKFKKTVRELRNLLLRDDNYDNKIFNVRVNEQNRK